MATFDLIADPATIDEGNFGTPITISLVNGSRPGSNVVISFTVSGTATGNFRNCMSTYVIANTLKIAVFSFLAISAGLDYEAPGDFTYTTFGSVDQSFNLEISEDSIAELTETIILTASVSSGSAQFSVGAVMINITDDDGA